MSQTKDPFKQAAALIMHGRLVDPSAHTRPAREAFLRRFEREVDPKGLLPENVRQRMAEQARRAYFVRLAAKSAATRQARKTMR
jgi:hypothetical protein